MSYDRFKNPYDRNEKLRIDSKKKEDIKSLKGILEIFNAEGVEPPPQIKEIRDYVDFIDNENPNLKGRDD